MTTSARSSRSKLSYIPTTASDREAMLEAIGAASINELFEQIPEALRLSEPPDIGPGLAEQEVVRHCAEMAKKNVSASESICFLGAGIYDHYVPSVVEAILQRGEFLTAYTPYQPEASQGLLQSIYEYQSMVCALTGMEVSNASLYDAGTAIGEAAIMSIAVTGRHRIVVSRALHPNYREVLKTYTSGLGVDIVEAPFKDGLTDPEQAAGLMNGETACLIVGYPNFFGCVEQLSDMAEAAHSHGALLVVCADPISLGLLKPPGELGADIVVGEGQSLGSPMSFGGPLLGLFACRQAHVRYMPGRVVGETVDTEGRTAYTLTLQTREQHIRREKATSNICSNEALLALAATVYLSALGKNGLRRLAELCYHKAHYAQQAITGKTGWTSPWNAAFVKEFVTSCKCSISELNKKLLDHGIIGGLDLGRYYPELDGHILWCVTEKRTKADIDRLVEVI